MHVKQLAVFLENKSGRLAEITHTLAQHAINIRAMSLADTADFGILRLVVNDTVTAQKVLKENGFTVGVTDVLAVDVADQPGALDAVLQIICKAGLNVEYMYAFTKKSGESGMLLFRFNDQQTAIKVLLGAGCRLLTDEEVHTL